MNGRDWFRMNDDAFVGVVYKVDSYRVGVAVPDDERLRQISVNGYVLLHTSDPNTQLVGRIERVVRMEAEHKYVVPGEPARAEHVVSNEMTVNALGTLHGPGGGRARLRFARAVETLPEIGAKCFLLAGRRLAAFAGLVADEAAEAGHGFALGTYAAAADAPALLCGNAFFGRHALIVGATGSGKSWAAATIVEQAAELPGANLLVFDVHGEYAPLARHPGIARYRIAGPGDLQRPGDDVLFLPYWLLGYEDMLALILDRSDDNAPNQAMAFTSAVVRAKTRALEQANRRAELQTFTIDSPVPYDLQEVVAELERLNAERVVNPRTGKENNGPFHGQFQRFLPRLAAKRSDRRHGFLFQLGEEQLKPDYLDALVRKLMQCGGAGAPGVKLLDFSEVPSDVLPIALSLVVRLVFQVQQWAAAPTRQPIALVCDEAHLYLPHRHAADASQARALAHFERIAKEGRKYGVSLLIVSQRPSELNATLLSQCGNVIAFRLTNPSDRAAVANWLPEHLGGIPDMLPTFDTGEAVVVGDACLLPGRIKVREPAHRPVSASLKFWDVWREGGDRQNLSTAVRNLRMQTLERAEGAAEG